MLCVRCLHSKPRWQFPEKGTVCSACVGRKRPSVVEDCRVDGRMPDYDA